MIFIMKDGKTVATGKNLRAIVRRAYKIGMDLVTAQEIRDDDDCLGAIVTFWFLDGSWSIVSFADYRVACDYIAKRQRRWDCGVNLSPVN